MIRKIVFLGWIFSAASDSSCGLGETCSRSCSGYPTFSCNFFPCDDCLACPAGFYCLRDDLRGSKNACPVGKYNPSTSSYSISACLSCGVGTYSSAGSGICCAVGYWSAAGSTACTACLPGTYSTTRGANSISSCLPCSAGTRSAIAGATSCTSCAAGTNSSAGSGICCALGYWSAPGSTTCTACLPGTFSATQGANSISACLSCSAGTWSSSAGARFCTSCAAGTYNPSAGSASISACLSCAPGTYNPSTAGTSVSSCLPCTAGTYNPYTSQSSCLSCAAGTYNPSPGSVSISACFSCAAGTYNLLTGSTYISACLPCASGTWSSAGSGSCTSCVAGTYNPSPASTSVGSCLLCAAGTYSPGQGRNSSTSCLPCAAGTSSSAGSSLCLPCAQNFFSAPGSTQCQSCAPDTYSASGSGLCCPLGSWSAPKGTSCTECPAGSYSSLPGSTSASSCNKCDIGSYAPTPGSSACMVCPLGKSTKTTGSLSNASCVLCGAGTYQDTLGQPCLSCPLNTYSTALGVTSVSYCQPCPDNGSTDAEGTPSLSLCKPFQCGPGLQPSIPTPLSSRDCSPITCPAPLLLSADGTGCAGCGPSLYGTPPACTPCPANSTCPGFFALPLNDPASLTTGSSACLAASTLTSPPVLIPNQPASFTLANIAPLATLCAAGGLAALVFSLLAYVYSPSTFRARLESFLQLVDSFSMSHIVSPGKPLRNRPTALGGACTLLSIISFLTIAAVLILQYSYANVNVQTSLTTLLSSNPFTPSVPWAPPLNTLSPAILSGVQLRLFAQEGMACSALAAGTSISGSPSGWTVSPPVSCNDGRSLLVLSCPTCSFTPTSFVKFYLPYTCQSIYLEAIAVDAQGSISSVVFPPASSLATSTALLSSLSWTVDVLGTLVKDAIKDTVMQGYQLSASDASVTPLAAGTSLIPAKALVAVTIKLPLQTFYSSIQLQPQQSLVSLFSSIVGLLGIIGLFRVLFMTSDIVLTQAALASKRRQSAAPLSSGSLPPQQEEPSFATVTNPLKRGAPRASAPVLVEVPTGTDEAGGPVPAPWKRLEDETDVWYYNEETQETSWTIPSKIS